MQRNGVGGWGGVLHVVRDPWSPSRIMGLGKCKTDEAGGERTIKLRMEGSSSGLGHWVQGSSISAASATSKEE